MAKHSQNAINPTRDENYPEWYLQVIKAADLAENSPVRGCMVIKPWGYSIWENIQSVLDQMFKETGHKNAYFPLFIPKSFIEKEAEHVEGFAKECAVVTHHRLEADTEGGLAPAGALEEPLVVRPTSETIIGEMFSKWVQSYRDLPLLINQWANIVRWEMRTRLFLRTSEFLWQEGHTVHASEEEAMQETLLMLDIYAKFAEQYLAMPVVKGLKTEMEKFPGADKTYCIEAMMQDKKALQAGTSHFLGQNFSRASDIKFQDQNGNWQYAWTTSWGVSTRLIGGLIMTHSDDDGLILPPRLAPLHVVIIPFLPKEETKSDILGYCEKIKKMIQACQFDGQSIQVEIDRSDENGSRKKWNWIKKGVPIRIEAGPRDFENQSVLIARRDLPPKQTIKWTINELSSQIPALLTEIQQNLYQKSFQFRENNTHLLDNEKDFYDFFKNSSRENGEKNSGFVHAYWNGSTEIEKKIKDELGVTIRCLPLEHKGTGKCIFTGETSEKLVIFSRAY